MVLVITGQLACSYDEEFRRLYARSIVPTLLSTSGQEMRDNLSILSSSQHSLHQMHMRPRAMSGLRSIHEDRFSSTSKLARGISVQDRLNQSHYYDMGKMVRGHSYGGDLHRLQSLTRLRKGTKDYSFAERIASNLNINSLSQQHLRHQVLYGSDQNVIPFCSETSLNKWKIDSYLNDSDTTQNAPSDVLSPLTSPYNSHIGLNEHQSQLIHSRSRDVKSRLEEIRQNRLSQHDLRQSQESVRSMYSTLERPKLMSSLRGLDMRQSVGDLDLYSQDSRNLAPMNHRDNEPKMGAHLSEVHRSVSHYDIKTALEQKTHDWHEPLHRTTSVANLDMKLNEPSLKHSQHPRAMESLMEIPEEKDSSNAHLNLVNSVNSSIHPESHHQAIRREDDSSIGYSLSSIAQREGIKSGSNETVSDSRVLNTNTGSQNSVDSKGLTEQQQEENPLQRKNSLRLKVYSLLKSEEKKASKKEEKSLQRKSSLKSEDASGSNQSLRSDNSTSAADQTTKKGQSPTTSRGQNAPAETEKHKSSFSFNRLSPQRLSKKKTTPTEEQDLGSRRTLNEETPTIYQHKREKAYSRFEYFLSTDNIPTDNKSTRTTSSNTSDSNPYLNRSNSGYSMYQTQSTSDHNRLGRFMQRVGNLIGKNK